jgi:hypothetical protein
LAVDIKLKGNLDVQSDDKCFRGLLILSRYFNAAGWFWGVSFPKEDAMHFEVAESTLKRWKREGKLDDAQGSARASATRRKASAGRAGSRSRTRAVQRPQDTH